MNKTFVSIGGNKELISSAATIVELEKQISEHARTTVETDDVLVCLEPGEIPVFKIRWDKTDTVLFCEPSQVKLDGKTIIPNGEPFRASIVSGPAKASERFITRFEYAQ